MCTIRTSQKLCVHPQLAVTVFTVPRIDVETRRRAVLLRRSGYSIAQIRERLKEENIKISSQALFNLMKKYNETGKLMDLY